MKQGWEIKKLGDITTSINGLWTGKKPPFITVAVIRNTNFTKDCKLDTSDIAYIDVEVKQYASRKLQCGDIIIEKSGGSDKQPVGRPILFNIEEGEYSFSNFTSTLRVDDRTTILPEFIHRYLAYIYMRGDTAAMQSKTTGIRNLDFTLYKSIHVPVPPREEQERIVEELDCLSGVIEKKREQLRELDALAQSIFYQMFGDPITNKKGWKVIPLKQAALLKAGKAIKATELSEDSDLGLYPCYGGNGIRGYINKKSHNGQFPIIGRQGALCGNVVFAQGEFYATEHAVVCNNIIESFNPLWLYYALKYNNLNRYAQGVAQPGISVNIINEMPLIYPTLILQQEFADKIEAIEKQKELIKQSITQTEELFNARMDYYFN